jgi:hypothetical protein
MEEVLEGGGVLWLEMTEMKMARYKDFKSLSLSNEDIEI